MAVITRRVFMSHRIRESAKNGEPMPKMICVATRQAKQPYKARRVDILCPLTGVVLASVVVYRRKREIAGHMVRACVEVHGETNLRIK